MKKIGILCLALVMALGSLGVAYAAWQETLTMSGTVDTGTVDIEIVGYSETHVYKTPDHGMVVVYRLMNLEHVVLWHSIDGGPLTAGAPTIGGDWLLIAAATVDLDASDFEANTVVVLYDNLFPSTIFGVDLLLHYDGSIPVRVQSIEFAPNDALAEMIADGLLYGDEAAFVDMGATPPTLGGVVDIGTQIHYSQYVMVVLWLEVPHEEHDLQGRIGSATYTVEVIQWNKYVE